MGRNCKFEENLEVYSDCLWIEGQFVKKSIGRCRVLCGVIQTLTDRLHGGKLPFHYLGFPIRANPKSLSMWDTVIEKFEKNLSSWKRQKLSLGGRITLIKLSLSSLPVYYMSLFWMPVMVIKKLD